MGVLVINKDECKEEMGVVGGSVGDLLVPMCVYMLRHVLVGEDGGWWLFKQCLLSISVCSMSVWYLVYSTCKVWISVWYLVYSTCKVSISVWYLVYSTCMVSLASLPSKNVNLIKRSCDVMFLVFLVVTM